MLLPFLLIAASTTTPVITTSAPAATTLVSGQQLRTAIGEMLQAHGTAARAALLSLPDGTLSTRDRAFRTCALSRLALPSGDPATLPGEASADPFVRDLLALYRAYWRESAMDEAARPAAERRLVAGLSRLLGQPALADIGDAQPAITAKLAVLGLQDAGGRTGVLDDMMIWNRDTQHVETVTLPDGSNPTRVHYLDGFLSLGWSSYLSCDRTGTGGWTTADGLYVIVPSYDSLTDENFRVNFLAHESQHYADKKRFGDLPGWRLEYRAKLVELAYADATRAEVLDRFTGDQGDDPADPHSYADRKVLRALVRRLGLSSDRDLYDVPLDRLHQAAVDELKADSGRLAASRRSASPAHAKA